MSDIIDTATSRAPFTAFIQALTAAELTKELKKRGPYTVFAPNNDAFAEFILDTGISADTLLSDKQSLRELLRYHIVKSKILAEDLDVLSDRSEIETLNGEPITIYSRSRIMISGAKVITADIQSKNGVLHIIDKVLIPKAFTREVLPNV